MNTVSDLKALDAQPVRVKPAIFDSQNSVGMWGSLRVRERTTVPGDYRVEVVLQFPEMFYRPAHEKIIPLTPGEVETLLASKIRDGAYEVALTSPMTREVPD